MSFTPRTISQIQKQIISTKESLPDLDGLTSTSSVAYWNLMTFIQAVASNLNEQAMAVFLDEIESVVALSVPGTAPWIQNEVLKFQYNTSTPQVVEVKEDFTIGYATVIPADQIISNCAVIVSSTGVLNIKVTTGVPAAPLNASQLVALNSYLNTVLAAGQYINVVSQNPDELAVYGTVFYNGQYNAAIQANVIAALDAYILKFSTSAQSGGSFNGLVKLSDIENVILAVDGVVDWQPSQVTVTAFGSLAPVNLVLSNTIISRSALAYSGYLKNDSANPFSATLSFAVAQN